MVAKRHKGIQQLLLLRPPRHDVTACSFLFDFSFLLYLKS